MWLTKAHTSQEASTSTSGSSSRIGINFKIIGIMLLTYIGMYGFSLVVGSLILSKKKIGQLNMIIQILLLVFSRVWTFFCKFYSSMIRII